MPIELLNQLQSVVAKVFGMSADQVVPDFKMGDHPRWDSMGHMDLVASVEKEFGVRFPSHALPQITSVGLIGNELSKLLNRV